MTRINVNKKKSDLLVKKLIFFFRKIQNKRGPILQHISFSIVYDPGGSTGKSSSPKVQCTQLI